MPRSGFASVASRNKWVFCRRSLPRGRLPRDSPAITLSNHDGPARIVAEIPRDSSASLPARSKAKEADARRFAEPVRHLATVTAGIRTLAVIDPPEMELPGFDENNAGTTVDSLAPLRHLTMARACLLLHHPRKGKTLEPARQRVDHRHSGDPARDGRIAQ
jgi:hypothetical protein